MVLLTVLFTLGFVCVKIVSAYSAKPSYSVVSNRNISFFK